MVEARNVICIYEVPIKFQEQGLDHLICEHLNIWSRGSDLNELKNIVKIMTKSKDVVTIGIVGKYVELVESYKSLNEALTHGGIENQCRVKTQFIASDEIEQQEDLSPFIGNVDGILVPGGFGVRGTEGMIRAIRFAREKNIPFFGICLGMQMAAVEFARNVCGLTSANSLEFDEKTPHPIISMMTEQKKVSEKGGTMRLGTYPCHLAEDSLAAKVYQSTHIDERHRHRFEVNRDYEERLSEKGLVISGRCPDNNLVEMIEINDHPWFVGCQFHPEFKSSPLQPHPLFTHFIRAAPRYQKSKHISKES